MSETSETKTQAPQQQVTVQGRTLQDNVLLITNVAVVIFSIVCMQLGWICVLLSNVDYNKYEFFNHGLQYMHLFFSLWGSAAQTIYYHIMLAIDIIEIYSRTNTKLFKIGNRLKTIANYLYFTAVFPMSVGITAMFWGLYYVDRELIYPKMLDQVYPTWINHAMHSIPGALAVFYLLFQRQMEPPVKHTLSGMAVILVFYGACVTYVKQRDNKWMYIGLHQLNNQQVTNLFVIGAVLSLYCTILGHDLVRFIHNFRKEKKDKVD